MCTKTMISLHHGILIAIVVTSVLVVTKVSSAAIPMWEYLSKDEKMSYLYSMFANQVEDFCEFHDVPDCNRALLKYGLGKLKKMPEDHLDTMDPYQRGAHSLIWYSMMEGHEMVDKIKPAHSSRTSPKPNSYEDDPGDYQGAGSARVEAIVYHLPPPKGFVITNGPSQYMSSSTARHPAEQEEREAEAQDAEATPPLTGPMVVKVHLDGTPVQEVMHLPQDEDLKQYKMSKAGLPTFH